MRTSSLHCGANGGETCPPNLLRDVDLLLCSSLHTGRRTRQTAVHAHFYCSYIEDLRRLPLPLQSIAPASRDRVLRLQRGDRPPGREHRLCRRVLVRLAQADLEDGRRVRHRIAALDVPDDELRARILAVELGEEAMARGEDPEAGQGVCGRREWKQDKSKGETDRARAAALRSESMLQLLEERQAHRIGRNERQVRRVLPLASALRLGQNKGDPRRS